MADNAKNMGSIEYPGLSGGSLATYGSSAFVTTSESIFNSAAFTVGAYETANDISKGALPGA